MWRSGDVLIVTLAGLIKLPDFASACQRVAAKLNDAPAPETWTQVEALLAILLVAWILGPVLARGVDPNGPGLSALKLRRFPFSTTRLLFVSLAGAAIQPIYWVLAVASLFAMMPLAAGANPGFGVASGILYLVLCVLAPGFVWLLVTAILGLPARVLIVLSGLVLWGLERLFTRYEWLIHADASQWTAFLSEALRWMPGRAVTEAARGTISFQSGLLLVGLVAGIFLGTILLLDRLLNHSSPDTGRVKRNRSLPPWPGDPAKSRIVAKDLAYTSRTLDFWIGIGVGLTAASYVAVADDPPIWVVLMATVAIGLNQIAGALNSFGLDYRAVDRFRLLPVTGEAILAAKNTAFLLASFAGLLPVVAAAAFRFGPPFAVAILFGSTGSLYLTALWGNIVSIRRPAPRPFFSMDSSEQSGGLIGAVVSVFIWILPLMLTLFVLRFGYAGIVPMTAAFAIGSWMAWRFARQSAGELFDRSAEEMRARLRE